MKRQFKTLAATSAVICTSGGSISRVQGFWDGDAVSYLQLFDAMTLPANDAVPDRVYALAADAGFDIELEEPFSFTTGLVLVFSTTRATKTLETDSGHVGDVEGAVYTIEPAGLTDSGDDTGNVDTSTGVAVWASATGSRLYRVKITGAESANRWLQLHTAAEPEAGDRAVFSAYVKVAGDFCFGREGWAVNGAAAGVCTVILSSTPDTLSGLTAAQATVRTWHFAGA